MSKQKEILIIVIVSALIGAIVAFPIILLTEETIMAPVLRAALAGVAIGLTARYTATYLFYNVNNHPVYTFVSIFIIILTGTIGAAVLYNTKAILFIIWMVALAEIAGMTASFILYRYILKLNLHLKKTQNKYNFPKANY